MPRTYARKSVRASYSKETLQAAITAVREHTMKVAEAAECFHVPETTIHDHLSGRRSLSSGGGGRRSDIPPDDESHIADLLKTMARCGFGLTRTDVLRIVGKYVNANDIKTRFKDGVPGEDWFLGFQKRHRLSLKKPELLESSRVKQQADPFVVYGFYDNLEELFTKLNLFNSPHRIANCDETSVCSDPTKTKVLAEINCSTSRATGGPGRENTSIMCCGFADGTLLPPLIIFQGKNLWKNWMPDGAFPGTTYAVSEKGWITTEIFEEWFISSFLPIAHQRAPCLLMFDGHVSHMSSRVVQQAQQHRVSIIVLPPHLSHLLQPLDRAVMKALKTIWDKRLYQWQRNHYGQRLSKGELAILLGKCWTDITVECVRNGFHCCGVFPLDRNKYPISVLDASALARYQKQDSQPEETSALTIQVPVDTTPCPVSFEEVLLSTVKQHDKLSAKRRKVRTHSIVLTRDDISNSDEENRPPVDETPDVCNNDVATNDGIVRVSKDGNCLFSAVATGYFKLKSIQVSSRLRLMAAKYVVDNWTMFSSVLGTLYNINDSDEYFKKMGHTSAYGDEPEICAMSKILDARIEVFSSVGGKPIQVHNDTATTAVRLLLVKEHYDLIAGAHDIETADECMKVGSWVMTNVVVQRGRGPCLSKPYMAKVTGTREGVADMAYLHPPFSATTDFYYVPALEDIDVNVPADECIVLKNPSNEERDRRWGYVFGLKNIGSAGKLLDKLY